MGWFGTAVSWSQRRGWKIPFFLAGAPLSVSEEHGYKRPQFASWVTACLVSPNFASLPLNYLQNNAQTNLHCGKTLDHKCEHTFVSFLVFNLDQHFDGICNFDHGHDLVTILMKVLPVIIIVFSGDNLFLIRLSPKIHFLLHHIIFAHLNFSCTIL